VDLVLVQAAKADAVFVNIMRVTAIFVGKKLGIGDHIVTGSVPTMSAVDGSR